jgi:hypothetical protein
VSGGRRDAPDFGEVIPLVRGALALAAVYFPHGTEDGKTYVRTADALFFLSGQVDKWSLWQWLPEADKALIAALLRWRPVEVANRTVFSDLLRILLVEHIPDFRAFGDGTILVETGRDPREVARDCVDQLWLEQQARPGRPVVVANSGQFGSWVNGGTLDARSGRATYSLEVVPKAVPEPLVDLGAAAQTGTIDVPVGGLAALASQVDEAFGETHRSSSVQTVFSRVRAAPGNPLGRMWTLRPGPTQMLNAPTGIGKNVIAELLACWAADRDMVTSLLVPSNAAVLRAARSVEASLRVLGIDAEVVPLMSPNSTQKEAEAAAADSGGSGTLGEWTYERLAYGCGLAAMAHTDEAVDAWDPGAEPCTGLRKVKDDGSLSSARATCPFKASCGKFRLARQACRATVIVTSHANFYAGRLHVPVLINGRVEQNPSVEEVLLHRSHLLLIDETDAFQASMIGHSARYLDLATRRPSPPSPLRRFDTEFNGALGRMGVGIEGRVHAALTQARYLAEKYNRHLAAGHFRLGRNGQTPGHPLFGRWLLPRRWDAWLAATMFNLPDGEEPSQNHYQALQTLFPMEEDSAVPVPEWLEPVAAALSALITPSGGYDPFDQTWDLIFALLAKHPYTGSRLDSNTVRAQVTDRMIRRAYLEPLRRLLFTLVRAAPELQASGIASATDIANALRQFGTWRAAPYGPLGRVLFAFTEIHDADHPQDTQLRVSGFGGDPHAYVTGLGELTALAHTGHQRAVIGLSATGYFPGAPHHHVGVRPAWWVPDDETGALVIRSAPVTDEEKQCLRISGAPLEERTDNLVKLGRLLWVKRLAPALRDLEAGSGTAHRARLLLAMTSYDGGRDLAEGISAAGVPADKIILAIRPRTATTGAKDARWTELPADRLEEFGRTVGTAPGSVLIAPLARTERGLNIVDVTGRALIGSVWLVVRPIPIMDEPAQLLAHVNARAHAEATPTDDPAGVLDLMRIAAGKHYGELFSSLPYFTALPDETQLAIAREILNGLIQLAGRARRGGASAEIWLVDYAFHDTSGNSDLPALIRRIRDDWDRRGQLHLMRSLYGETLAAIFRFADERTPE